ncbi:MAG: mechanosensitive ion channel family protein [Gallionella sp.]|nr:mechanosensitive ion channel family protein [Gallionella sp.]
MSFWHTAIEFFWHEEFLPVMVIALCLTFLLYHFLNDTRKNVLNTLTFFIACEFLRFFSGILFALQFVSTANILREVGAIGAGIAIIRLWGILTFRFVLPRAYLTPPRIAEDIFVIVAYAAWGLVRLRFAGLDLGSIVATSAMITAVVAFAMQDTLGNILGGLALQLDNSIEIGDWIKVDDVTGRVVDIRWRSTLVETRNWETVVFPNSQLMKGKFLVLGRRMNQPVQLRRWIWFNVNLNITPTKVAGTVEDAIVKANLANVAKTPAPSCVLMEMDKGCARYALRYWLTNLAVDDPTDAMVRWHIYAALERDGIKLVLEEHSMHLIKENEKFEEMAQRHELERRIKTLHRVELFAQMSDKELKHLATHLKYAPFARGDLISKQGAIAHWLYIIINGDAEVYVEASDGTKHTLNVLSKGNFFGEMGMMTGAPRSASVLAKTDVECYRLDKAGFEGIMQARPAIAEEVTHILVERRAELDHVLQDAGETIKLKETRVQHNEILATIKGFFGL